MVERCAFDRNPLPEKLRASTGKEDVESAQMSCDLPSNRCQAPFDQGRRQSRK